MSSTTAKASDARFTVSSVFNALVFGGGFGALCAALAVGLLVREGEVIVPLFALSALGWAWAAHRRVLVVDDRKRTVEVQWRLLGLTLRRRSCPFAQVRGVRVQLTSWMGQRWQRSRATDRYEAQDTGRRWSYRVHLCAQGFAEELFHARDQTRATGFAAALAGRLRTSLCDHHKQVDWPTPPRRVGAYVVALLLLTVAGLAAYGHINRKAELHTKLTAASQAQGLASAPDIGASAPLEPGVPVMIFHGAAFWEGEVARFSSAGPVRVRFADGFGRQHEVEVQRDRLRRPAPSAP